MFFRSGECIDSGMLRAVHRLELLKEFLTSPFLNPALLFFPLFLFMSESHLMFENTSIHQETLDYKGVTRALLELHRSPCLLFWLSNLVNLQHWNVACTSVYTGWWKQGCLIGHFMDILPLWVKVALLKPKVKWSFMKRRFFFFLKALNNKEWESHSHKVAKKGLLSRLK